MNRQSGIDTEKGNSCSRVAFTWAKKSFSNRLGRPGTPSHDLDGSFANILSFGDLSVGISSDGIGTKIECAERIKRYDSLGFDLLAMVLDDLVTIGLEPVGISNILDVDFLDESVVDHLMHGLHDAAREARVIITGGEIAELGSRIGGYGTGMHFNWCATAFGVLPPGRKPLDGRCIQPGDRLIALRSAGFRSNGFSKIRMILESAYGPEWHDTMYDDVKTWGTILLTPSRIYARAVSDLLERNVPISGIAHITGGGIADNLKRVLAPLSVGAVLDALVEPHDCMLKLQQLGSVPEEEAYRLWNMGCGMLLTTPSREVPAVIQFLGERGIIAREAGSIQAKPQIEITTSGADPTRIIVPVKPRLK